MMIDPGGMNDLASQSLDLVNRELSSTLETARHEIEDYVEGFEEDPLTRTVRARRARTRCCVLRACCIWPPAH